MRPLLVLVLVLGAIAALLFAVFSLDSNTKQANPDLPTATSTAPANPGPTTPLETDHSSVRTVAPNKGGEAAPAGGPANVFDNKVTGLVQNMAGEPVGGADVTLTAWGSEEMVFLDDPVPDMTKEPHARTTNDGRYTFLGVQPRDRYSLIVEHPDYARRTVQSMPIGEAGQVDQPPIVLEAGATLSGVVRNEPGDLVPDATMYLEGSEFAGLLNNTAPDRMTTKSNKDGFYTFRNVPAGNRTLTVLAQGYGQEVVPQLVFQKEDQITRDVTVRIAEMICGRVIGPNNEGVPDANVIAVGVSATQQSARGQTKTNEKGEFCFEHLKPGDYNVIAAAKGYRSTPGRNNRVSTNTSNLVIEMFKEATVCGSVVDASTNKPIPSFTVRLRFWYGGGSPSAPSQPGGLDINNAAGEYCIEGVPASDYVVEAFAPGYAPTFSQNFNVQPSKSVSGVLIKLTRGGSISGRVVDADGKPVARARIQTHDKDWVDDALTVAFGITYPSDATALDIRTDGDGKFTCSNLTPETYLILVSAPGFTQLTKKDIRVNEGATVNVGDLKVGRGGAVEGTLFDAAGKPISGGSIVLQPLDGDNPKTYSTKSAADGRFQIRNAPGGRYKLTGSRGNSGDANPFTDLVDTKNSEVQIIIAENDTTRQDLRLTN